jgi:hypothetical protein
MNETIKYYIEIPIRDLGGHISGWARWRPSNYWDFGTWEETHKYCQDEFNTLEEAQEAVHREGLVYYRIYEDIHTWAVVDSQYRE